MLITYNIFVDLFIDWLLFWTFYNILLYSSYFCILRVDGVKHLILVGKYCFIMGFYINVYFFFYINLFEPTDILYSDYYEIVQMVNFYNLFAYFSLVFFFTVAFFYLYIYINNLLFDYLQLEADELRYFLLCFLIFSFLSFSFFLAYFL